MIKAVAVLTGLNTLGAQMALQQMMELMKKTKNSTQRVVLLKILSTSAPGNGLHVVCKAETLLLMITVYCVFNDCMKGLLASCFSTDDITHDKEDL